MAAESQVQAGRRYRAMTSSMPSQLSNIVWEVDRLTVGTDGIQYVRLIRSDDRGRKKTISLEALLDRHYFRPDQ